MSKSKTLKAYKIFDSKLQCRGHQFKVGKSYHQDGKIELCNNGWHFCRKPSDLFKYYEFDSANRVCEVEVSGIISHGDNKSACSDIRLLRELTWHEVLDLVNVGKNNTGKENSGNRNSGSCNSGHCNSGNYNSGNYNSGSYNSGSYNSGDRNSGHYNSGNRNSGHYNSGNRNSGDYNSGHYNSGHYNSGHYNSGDYNSGSYNSGWFNTTEPTIRLFNKDTGKLRRELNLPHIDLQLTEWDGAKLISRTYQEAWKIAWAKLSPDAKQQFLDLPGFDSKIFKEITGITVKNPSRRRKA